MVAAANLPYEETQEVLYSVEEPSFNSRVNRKFLPHISILANQGFSVETQKV